MFYNRLKKEILVNLKMFKKNSISIKKFDFCKKNIFKKVFSEKEK
jgi:hypothetical protein